jgi:polyphosphate kinase 2 (PPK2 family)
MKAYGDVFERTSTEKAPWYVIPADQKWMRNLIISDILVKTMQDLGMNYPDIDFNPAEIQIED